MIDAHTIEHMYIFNSSYQSNYSLNINHQEKMHIFTVWMISIPFRMFSLTKQFYYSGISQNIKNTFWSCLRYFYLSPNIKKKLYYIVFYPVCSRGPMQYYALTLRICIYLFCKSRQGGGGGILVCFCVQFPVQTQLK